MHHVKPKILKPDGKQRFGRGFSPNEFKKAGLTPADGNRLGLPADLRRKTAHDENVEVIKAYVEKEKAKIKPKPKPDVTVKKEKAKS
jgi:ribosomal protein L13E